MSSAKRVPAPTCDGILNGRNVAWLTTIYALIIAASLFG